MLLASVTSKELMMGKLLGIGLAGLTTIGTWLLSFFVLIVTYYSAQTDLIGEVLEVILGSDLIPWFVFYYFLGYALYSGLFLAVGGLCNTLKEAQAMMTPMIVIQIVPLTMMAFVVMDPNNGLAVREYRPDDLAIRQNFPAGCLANRSASTRQRIVETVDRYCVTPSLSAASASLCESKPQCTQRLARRFINTCFT